jgi:putative sigma-54 modulation protein
MNVHFTARRFKAEQSIRDHALASVQKLDRFYDGILRCDVILSIERMSRNVKAVEVNAHVYGMILTAKERSDDFVKSIDLAVDKIERQLSKYKTKLRMKNKKQLRRVKEATTPSSIGEEE